MLAALLLNTADIYFLQSENTPPLHRSISFWMYVLGHSIVALLAAFLLYEKASVPIADWPIVTAVAGLGGFSILQSLTLKFGDTGIDARDLFDSWKRRVVEDISRVNLSRKRTRQLNTARELVRKAETVPNLLEPAVRLLAPSVQLDPEELIQNLNSDLLKAQWIASVDLEYARNLLQSS